MKLIRSYLFGLLMLMSVGQALAAQAIVQTKTGVSTVATVTAAFDTTPTNGNLIVLIFSSDDYNGSPNAGWTQSTGMEQQTSHGGYLWWRIASGGSNSFQYTIGSATNSAWILLEISGADGASPYDISNGAFTATGTQTFATPSIIPTTGNRLLIATTGGSFSGPMAGYNSGNWTNSFTNITSVGSSGTGTNDFVGVASRLVTGNSATGYTTSGDILNGGGGASTQSRSGLIISFKEASGGGSAPVLSSPAPSGTLGTTTTATAGATTDQSTGTYYAVVDTAGNLSGVTDANIKAGQKTGGTSALASCNVAVSTTSPSCGVTGLTASTAYTVRMIQNNANGDSNQQTNTFTTATSAPTLSGRASLLGAGR